MKKVKMVKKVVKVSKFNLVGSTGGHCQGGGGW